MRFGKNKKGGKKEKKEKEAFLPSKRRARCARFRYGDAVPSIIHRPVAGTLCITTVFLGTKCPSWDQYWKTRNWANATTQLTWEML